MIGFFNMGIGSDRCRESKSDHMNFAIVHFSEQLEVAMSIGAREFHNLGMWLK